MWNKDVTKYLLHMLAAIGLNYYRNIKNEGIFSLLCTPLYLIFYHSIVALEMKYSGYGAEINKL